MDYSNNNITKDKAKTWKKFNKFTIYTIIFVSVILIVIFNLFQPTISFSLKKNAISFLAFSNESDP